MLHYTYLTILQDDIPFRSALQKVDTVFATLIVRDTPCKTNKIAWVWQKSLLDRYRQSLQLWNSRKLFSRRTCYHHNTTIKTKSEVAEKLSICKFGSVHFCYIIHPKKLRNLQVGDFYGTYRIWSGLWSLSINRFTYNAAFDLDYRAYNLIWSTYTVGSNCWKREREDPWCWFCSRVSRCWKIRAPGRTVKASNFGPHWNFGPFLSEGLAITKTRHTHKGWERKLLQKTFDLQTLFNSCFVQNSSKEATDLARIRPKFPWGAQLDAFAVYSPDHLLLDRSPNIGPPISRWELDKFINCWNKSFRTS